MNIALIGAGLGGLSAACLLATGGHSVTVYEKNDRPGGKINQVQAKGYRFDTGPSLLTMPGILRDFFKRCDSSLDNYLHLQPVDPICRYFYPDGSVFNCYKSKKRTIQEIEQLAPADAGEYSHFLDYSKRIYHHVKDAFLFNPLYNLRDLRSLRSPDVFKIDALYSVSDRVNSIVESSYMRQFLKRFPTYNGSSPYQAPATLNVIPHVELNMGGYYIDGGMYKLIEALMQLASSKGVKFNFNTCIESIEIENKKVTGIRSENRYLPADLVISNSDASATYMNLIAGRKLPYLKKKRLQKIEPSCSGLVLLLGINRKYEQLTHHNVFFSNDYRTEFKQIFKQQVMPDDPTIYIANTSEKNPDHATRGGSNLFILINAPYLSGQWDWVQKKEKYSNFIIDTLERRGLRQLGKSTVYQHCITPMDFQNRYQSNKGSIYGSSSNSKMAAFLRPKNKARGIHGLYLVGGSTHPGGGIPLVILSAFHAVELIGRYE